MLLQLVTFTLLATASFAQNIVSWTEGGSGARFSLAIPDEQDAPFNIYGSIVVPVNTTWASIAFGGCMLRSPLVVAWRNSTNVVVAPRWATAFHPPEIYADAEITLLKSSSINSTHWTANWVCTGCSSWEGGELKALGNIPLGWGMSNRPVRDPASVNSSIPFHNVGMGHFEVNITNARNSEAYFAALTSED
ncbi:hypothetical protein B0J14DRAFT_586295 [Halenospora varia]|nr:hypothetical protein B0J14DRAFT_586295 [Halenospora varia]